MTDRQTDKQGLLYIDNGHGMLKAYRRPTRPGEYRFSIYIEVPLSDNIGLQSPLLKAPRNTTFLVTRMRAEFNIYYARQNSLKTLAN